MKQALTQRIIFNKVQPRAAFAGMLILLALLAMLCLSGCGGTARANSAAANTSNKQAQAPAANGTSVSDGSMPGMTMQDETVAGANTNQGSAGNQPSQQVGDSSVGSSNETVVQAALVEWSIQLSRSEVPAGKIRFVVTNQGKMPHNLTVQDGSGVIAATPNFRPAQGSQTLEVDLKPGTYTLLCSIPGHAKKGQVTTLVVK